MFRFSLRELALVTVIVAIATAWWLDRTILTRQLYQSELAADHLKTALQFQGFSVNYLGDSLVVDQPNGSRYTFGIGAPW